MVTPYAPYRDGIANYALQEVAHRRALGETVEVLSPVPSAAHRHLPLGGIRGAIRLIAIARGYDRVCVQFFPEILFGACRHRLQRVAVWVALGALARVVPTELRVHEIDYADATVDGLMRKASTRALAAADVTVHTESERRKIIDTFGSAVTHTRLIAHGEAFQRRTSATRAEARESFGIGDDAHVFVSIGFIQRHKGFDRAVTAIERLHCDRVQLHVVGGIRVDHPELATYADELRTLIQDSSRAELHEGYVGDEEFDRWIVAADTLVLPYREIWSSGVVERAALYGTPLIVTGVGGLADQVGPESTVVADDEELAEAMASAAGCELGRGTLDSVDVPADRAGIEAIIRRRAGATLDDADRSPLAAYHGFGAIPPAIPVSTRPFVGRIKRLIQRLTHWELEPVTGAVEDLARRNRDAATILDERLSTVEEQLSRGDR